MAGGNLPEPSRTFRFLRRHVLPRFPRRSLWGAAREAGTSAWAGLRGRVASLQLNPPALGQA